MENKNLKSSSLVADTFVQYHQSILGYVRFRINDDDDAEDLAQDVFVRLMEYQDLLRPETAKSFVFTIARNLVIDYLRRLYKKQEITSYMYDMQDEVSDETMDGIVARDIENHERMKLLTLPAQRQKVYTLSRFENKTSDEIAEILQLSRRTVENHLRISRHEVREYIKACI